MSTKPDETALHLIADLSDVTPEELGRVIVALERIYGHELEIVTAQYSPPGTGPRSLNSEDRLRSS